MRRDELSWRKFAPRLISARTDVSVRRFAVTQLRGHIVVAIEDANLTVKIRANHPITLSMKVAGHSQMGFVFDGAHVVACQRESLNAPVPAVGDE